MLELRLKNVTFGYGDNRPIFLDLDSRVCWTAAEGEIQGLMGASGVGKTTLFDLLSGKLRPSSGEILRSPSESTIVEVQQSPVLLDHLSVADNLRLFRYSKVYGDRYSEDAVNRMESLLELPKDSLTRLPTELSGGQRQMVALIRALSVMPDLLLLDEPCTGLDGLSKYRFLDALQQACQASKTNALYCSHHLDEIGFVCQRAHVISDVDGKEGRSIKQYDRATLLKNPPTLGLACARWLSACSVLPAYEFEGILSDAEFGVAGEQRVLLLVPGAVQSGRIVRELRDGSEDLEILVYDSLGNFKGRRNMGKRRFAT